ncbi:MAG: hypothetical protein JSW23_02670 [Planctomycetota bacterium]|nr:MAG: hypothetical protein JSW23_02670 [Planctomycetota bacterium]
MEPNEGANQGGEVSSETSQTGGGKGWKTAIFVIVVLAAGAMAAHSVLTNGKVGSLCCGSGIGSSVSAADKVCTGNPACTGDKSTCQKACCAAANKTCEKTKQCTHSKQASDCSVSNPDKSASGCCPKPASGCCAKAEASAEIK